MAQEQEVTSSTPEPVWDCIEQPGSCGCTRRRSSAWRAGVRSPDAGLEGDGIFALRTWTLCSEPV
jgi:hypothetical protein